MLTIEVSEPELKEILAALDFYAEFGSRARRPDVPLGKRDLSDLAWRLAAPIEAVATGRAKKEVGGLLGFLNSIRIGKAF